MIVFNQIFFLERKTFCLLHIFVSKWKFTRIICQAFHSIFWAVKIHSNVIIHKYGRSRQNNLVCGYIEKCLGEKNANANVFVACIEYFDTHLYVNMHLIVMFALNIDK